MTDTPISVFRSAQSTKPVTARLGAFLNSKRHRAKVLQVRAEADKTQRDELKKTLPAATVSGIFKHRSAAGLQEYNGLVCMDFDAKENPGMTPVEMRAVLAQFDEVAYAGLSVSGQGVFAIIATNNANPADHADTVDLLGAVLAQFDLYYDRACKDVCRLRFVSYDPEAHWNTAPAKFNAQELVQLRRKEELARRPRAIKVQQQNFEEGSTREKKVNALVEAIEARATDITGVYDDWMRLGMALANEFGPNGESYFQRISKYHPKYDPREVEKKFANFLGTSSQVHIGTFFKICNDHNIRLT